MLIMTDMHDTGNRQMMVHEELLKTRKATARGFTAAPHASAGNAGSAALPQAPLQAHA
jgi:hypothetical protein